MNRRRLLTWTALILAVPLLLAQAVPYGRDHANPPVTAEPEWDSPRTRELARRACFDCHSNETRWPWYSNIAPLSWQIQGHVDEGRQELNFSTFDRPQEEAEDAAEGLLSGEMPPWDYLLVHPEARLTASEKAELARGFRATFGGESEGRNGRHLDDECEES